MRGTHLAYQVTRETNIEAGRLLERAIELDSQLARAFTMLSHVHLLAYVNGWKEQPEKLPQRALELALQAIGLDNDDPEGHWNLGLIYLWRRQHDLAIAAERRALHLNPNFASAHAGLGNVLHYTGRSSEAVEPLLTAMRLDPYYSEIWLHFLALAYFGAGRYEDAAATLKRRIIRRPDTDISRVLLAACYGYLGRGEEAQALWQDALRLNPQYSLEQKRRILPYKNSSDFDHFLDGLHKAGLPE